MKNIYILLTIVICAFTTQAQQNVSLKINHNLGNASFAFNQTAMNDLGNSFTVTRLQYYISEIKLTHDGGIVTNVPNTYILVDASTSTNVALGSFNITNLESISFGVGVEAPMNNADPNLHPSTHPLAPKSPSMHWGWSAGYRFVAFEGKTGTNMSQNWQIHALGNRNYRSQNIVTSGNLQNGVLIAELDADYTQGLAGITVNSNLLTHGEYNEAATLLANFQSGVFSQFTVGLNESNQNLLSFGISPNPSNGQLRLKVNRKFSNLSYKVINVLGKEIMEGVLEGTENHTLSINQEGIFMVNLFNNGELIGSEKVIIQ